jgi:hypothetical protein
VDLRHYDNELGDVQCSRQTDASNLFITGELIFIFPAVALKTHHSSASFSLHNHPPSKFFDVQNPIQFFFDIRVKLNYMFEEEVVFFLIRSRTSNAVKLRVKLRYLP